MSRALLVFLGSCAFVVGCSGDDTATPDGGPDANVADASLGDAAPDDAGDADPENETGEAATCPTPSTLVEALRGRAKQLDERARALDEREHSLKQLEKAIDTRLENLEKAKGLAVAEVERLSDIRDGNCREAEEQCAQKLASLRQEYGELEQGLANWDDAQKQQASESRDTEVARLTKALTTMRPEKAAATLSALDSDTAALLLSQIPERSSGKILAALDPAKTAEIVQRLLEKAAPASRSALSAVAHNTKTKAEAEESNEGDTP
jgi:flagellar motility protein MotE (MotC chaperone)